MIITKQNFARDKNMEYQSVRLQKKILITRKRKKGINSEWRVESKGWKPNSIQMEYKNGAGLDTFTVENAMKNCTRRNHTENKCVVG